MPPGALHRYTLALPRLQGKPMRWDRIPRAARLAWAMLLPLALLAGCTTRTANVATYQTGQLPRPAVVLVEDFAIDPATVMLDPGVAATLRRASGGEPDAVAQQQAALHAQGALSQALISRISAMGLPAEPAVQARPGQRAVEISGRIDAINEGNQTRRRVIGFGAGKSRVSVSVSAAYVGANGRWTPMTTFDAASDSGRRPGLALGLGAGAATGAMARGAAVSGGMAVAGYKHGTVEADAQALAGRIAQDLQAVFARHGWVRPPSLP